MSSGVVYWTGAEYGTGPGVITGGVAQGSHGLQGVAQGSQGGHGVAQAGMHGSHTEPRHSPRQQRHPTREVVSTSTAVRMNSFFMTRISNRNVTRGGTRSRHDNSTTRFVMCKRNRRAFSETRFLPFHHA